VLLELNRVTMMHQLRSFVRGLTLPRVATLAVGIVLLIRCARWDSSPRRAQLD